VARRHAGARQARARSRLHQRPAAHVVERVHLRSMDRWRRERHRPPPQRPYLSAGATTPDGPRRARCRTTACARRFRTAGTSTR
jgi:hypothetical protein